MFSRTFADGRTANQRSWNIGAQVFLPCFFYAVVVGFVARRHEPWADEAQAWLLARDSGLIELWSKLLRLEGTPGLWHSIVHVLIRLGLPYTGFNLFSGAIGLAAAFVFLREAPFSLVARVLVPFTYFFLYQYSIIARSYSLIPLLVFLIAARFRADPFRVVYLAVLLGLLALVSLQACLLSLIIAATLAFRYSKSWPSFSNTFRKRAIFCASLYFLVILGISVTVWPSRDVMFVGGPTWSFVNFVHVAIYGLGQAFGQGYWSVAIMFLSLPVLVRGIGVFFLLMAGVSLLFFAAVVYSNVWHYGFLVLAWLFALWISIDSSRSRAMATPALLLFAFLQCYWSVKAINYDWNNSYSGARGMAKVLRNAHVDGSNTFGIGFPGVAVQPYFRKNIFKNYGDEHSSYWLWSKAFAANDAGEHLGSMRPDYVVLGYSSESDWELWHHLIVTSGFNEIAHAEGSSFWETDVFESQNYELFRPGAQTKDTTLASEIVLEHDETNYQLVSGFLENSRGNGRWVAANCSALLQRPELINGSSRRKLEVEITIPKETIDRVGPLQLTAFVSGRRLSSETYVRAGSYRFARQIESSDLYSSIVPLSLTFKKPGFFASALPSGKLALLTRLALRG